MEYSFESHQLTDLETLRAVNSIGDSAGKILIIHEINGSSKTVACLAKGDNIGFAASSLIDPTELHKFEKTPKTNNYFTITYDPDIDRTKHLFQIHINYQSGKSEDIYSVDLEKLLETLSDAVINNLDSSSYILKHHFISDAVKTSTIKYFAVKN